MINRESIAWAAGFFDGEGSIHANNHTRRSVLTLSVCQLWEHRDSLERFRDAFGLGGALYLEARVGRPMGRYQIYNFEWIQAMIAMMWPWLSRYKREQYTIALQKSAMFSRKTTRGQSRYIREFRKTTRLWVSFQPRLLRHRTEWLGKIGRLA